MNNDAFELVKGSLSRKGRIPASDVRREPTLEEIEELFQERITPETDLPPMQPLFQMFDVPCFYRGELVATCGKAKSGKTFFLSIIMAACLTEKVMALERYAETAVVQTTPTPPDSGGERKPLQVLWVDTEQSQQSTQEIMVNRIIPLAKESVRSVRSVCDLNSVCDLDSTLFAFNLRGLGFEKRGKMVEVAMRAVKPDIVIIDGIKDLMTDINDAVQATLIMEKMMALAKEMNCCIVCVLHQNKSEQDRNMRGSIGTELTNKAFEVYQCEIIDGSPETFKVTQTYSRKQKMKRKLYYRVNDQGLPELCADYREQPRDDLGRWTSTKQTDAVASEISECDIDLRELFTKAMEGRNQRPFGEVMAVALKKCGVLDAATYYAYFAKAESQEIIRKEVHPETGVTWVELIDNSLPF